MNENAPCGKFALKKPAVCGKMYRNKTLHIFSGGNMKKIISLLAALIMLFGCCVQLVGCGAPDNAGAEIDIYLGNSLYDFDPTDYYADSNAEQVMSLLFEPLFRINKKGKLECAGAEDYEIDYEERKIVIELAESYWSDDTRVCAADYVYAWTQRLLNPNEPTPSAALLYDIENAAAVKSGVGTISDIGAVASGVYEITITYRQGADCEQLLRNLASIATAPIRQAIYESAPSYWTKTINTMVFNGPFKIRALNYDTNELSLERNLGYHQEPTVEDYDNNVRPNQLISFTTAPGEEIEVSYADIESKTTFLMLDAPLADRVANKSKAEAYDDTSVYSYVFNTENPLFADARVRRALSVVIDRNAIAAAVAFGKTADGFLPDVSGGSSASLITSGADLALAESLLGEVDFTGLSKSFTLTVANNEESLKIAELVKESWELLGFTVTVKAVKPVSTTLGEASFKDCGIQALVKEASYGNRKFDVIGIDWQTYSEDAFVGLAAFSSTLNGCGVDYNKGANRSNISGWVNSEYDYLISTAFKTNDEEVRASLLADAEKLLVEEAPIAPILFNQSFAFAHKDISKLAHDGFGNFILTDLKQKNYEDYLED